MPFVNARSLGYTLGMQVVYSGGFDKRFSPSEQASVLYAYQNGVRAYLAQGKQVAFVTLAKPDSYFTERLRTAYGGEVHIIGEQNLSRVSWSTYGCIFLLGGNALKLHRGLKVSGFALAALKPDVLLIGDSSGAFVLASHYYDSSSETREQVTFYEALNPAARLIVIAHADNPVYVNPALVARVEAFAVERSLRVLKLKENEVRLLASDGEFVSVTAAELIT